MAWSASPNKQERAKRRERVDRGTILGLMSISVPAKTKAWLLNEAHRRYIPVSWLVTEILEHGIEAYKLMTDNVTEDE